MRRQFQLTRRFGLHGVLAGVLSAVSLGAGCHQDGKPDSSAEPTLRGPEASDMPSPLPPGSLDVVPPPASTGHLAEPPPGGWPDDPPGPITDPDAPGAGPLVPEEDPAAAWHVAAPVRLATLVGPDAEPTAGEPIYGTDLGISFEHGGKHSMLFGDTWDSATTICRAEHASNDDTLAGLSETLVDGVLPVLDFVTNAVDKAASTLEVLRGDDSLSMGFGQVPMAAFSDGQALFVTFARLEPTHCGASAQAAGGRCATEDGFVCLEHLGECQPAQIAYPLVCDSVTQLGCYPGQTCEPVSLCMDPTSSQYDGTFGGETSAVTQETEIAVQRAGSPTTFDSVKVLSTSKFSNMTARTVQKLSEHSADDDYTPGHGDLLIWGRPGFVAEHGREAQLYLMTHSLPLAFADDGSLQFTPRYFAGVDETSGEPVWSDHESEARPLALDGRRNGDPHEDMQIVNQMSVSWLGAPVNRWVMLYGGDVSPFLLADPDNAHTARAPGSLTLRFAEHPWGPWSAPQAHLMPGNPAIAGDPYGPGGYVFHPDCVDAKDMPCAKSDPARPPDSVIPGCPISLSALDPGRLYGVNIIDAFSKGNDAGGMDLVWNVSTWNPYTVQLMKTTITPAEHAPPVLELSDAAGLRKLGRWEALPELPAEHGRYVQQSSRDRGEDDSSFPLSGHGNKDFNNFVCASKDATLAATQITPFTFDEASCAEDYVHGAVLARIEGAGHMVRMWLGMLSLTFGEADDEILRLYVDDEALPRVEVPLRDALDGRAGEIFAPPFGAGSPRRLAWYYPVAFQHKLIVALDHLGENDAYYYHVDAVLDPAHPPDVVQAQRLAERDSAVAQLGALYHPASARGLLGSVERIELGGLSGQPRTQSIELTGPATIHEVRLHLADADLAALASVQVSVRWDGEEQPSIDVPLLELFASGLTPPERPSAGLVSFLEGDQRVLSLQLPMPFASAAELTFTQSALGAVHFDVELRGTEHVPSAAFGHLHVQRVDTRGPTTTTHHLAVDAKGRGRLVGLCAMLEGHPDPAAGIQFDPLNLLEGDVEAHVDGQTALWGTGTEEYADDVFYFTDAPHGSPFVQAWGRVDDLGQSEAGEVNMCRFHVLGTELDFDSSLSLDFELGGAANPQIVDRIRTIAFLYQ